MASKTEIDRKINLAVEAQERDDFETAGRYLRSAATLIVATPDREFDGQKVEYRERVENMLKLLDEFRARENSKAPNNGWVHIPVLSKR